MVLKEKTKNIKNEGNRQIKLSFSNIKMTTKNKGWRRKPTKRRKTNLDSEPAQCRRAPVTARCNGSLLLLIASR